MLSEKFTTCSKCGAKPPEVMSFTISDEVICHRCMPPKPQREDCPHKNAHSLLLLETEDHVVLCLDCRSVIHWCNDTEDQWRDLENSRPTKLLE